MFWQVSLSLMFVPLGLDCDLPPLSDADRFPSDGVIVEAFAWHDEFRQYVERGPPVLSLQRAFWDQARFDLGERWYTWDCLRVARDEYRIERRRRYWLGVLKGPAGRRALLPRHDAAARAAVGL